MKLNKDYVNEEDEEKKRQYFMDYWLESMKLLRLKSLSAMTCDCPLHVIESNGAITCSGVVAAMVQGFLGKPEMLEEIMVFLAGLTKKYPPIKG